MGNTLREVTMEGFNECIGLDATERQRGVAATDVSSLAKAEADGVSNPFAGLADDQAAGSSMIDFDPKEDRGYGPRPMVDARFHGNGHGRASISAWGSDAQGGAVGGETVVRMRLAA